MGRWGTTPMSERGWKIASGARGALTLLAALALLAPAPGVSQERTLTSSRQIQGTQPVRVDVESGAGTLRIGTLDGGDLLYQMNLRYDEQVAVPVTEFDSAGRTLQLGLRGRQSGGGRVREGSRTEVELTREVPIDLAMRFGAGEATLELGGMRLRSLSVETGASETSILIDQPNPQRASLVELKAGAAEIRAIGLGNLRSEHYVFRGGVGAATLDFGGAWSADATANIDMGMGALILRFPRSLGVRIDRSSFLTRFDAADFGRRDGRDVSNNWDTAPHHITINLNAALGSVEVRWIDE